MVWLRGVEISAGAVAAGEGGGGHESAVKNVSFFNLGGVEKGWKTDGVKKADDGGVWGQKGPRRHVASENSGLVFLHSGCEVFELAFAVEVAQPIFDGPEKWEAAPAGDFSGR